MTEQDKSNTERYLEQLMAELEPDSTRYTVLASARQFKSSWAELGAKLVEVKQGQLFKDWGYEAFEEYCSREIRIRRLTAEKLTNAYGYLQRHQPALLQRDADAPLPDYRAVDLVSRAEDEGLFDPAQINEFKQAVFEQNRPLAAVRKDFNAVVRQLEPAEESRRRQLQQALAACRRLRTILAATTDPPDLGTTDLPALESSLLAALEEMTIPDHQN